jgi:NTP pyrophosphatase (non-canonical NTP hydrolase)
VSGMTLADAQAAVDAWISRFEEGYWPPLANLARLADLALELADILFVLIAIANEQGIDLDTAFRRVLQKYQTRDATRWTER